MIIIDEKNFECTRMAKGNGPQMSMNYRSHRRMSSVITVMCINGSDQWTWWDSTDEAIKLDLGGTSMLACPQN